jgi:hypothetical protein
MTFTFRHALFLSTLSVLIACGEADADAGPEAAPTSVEEVETQARDRAEMRQAVSDLGIAARAIEDAENLDGARDALGAFEQQLGDAGDSLPEGLADRLQTDLEAARDAVSSDDLAGVQNAGQALIRDVLVSERVQEPGQAAPE